MQTGTVHALQHQLLDRRARLREALTEDDSDAVLVRLLQQVDAALDRFANDEYARCLVCRGRMLEEDLLGNPLLEYCLCGLTPEQQSALEHDLELARRIQTALLPDPRLEADGWESSYRYEPAGVVSGDYCDLWVTGNGDGALTFAVGDVSGKGVAASLLMAHLQAAFRSLVGAGVSLSETVEQVNRQLLEATIPSHYATLACGRARADGTVEVVNAGHTPPLIARRGSVEALGPTGFPIGLVGDRPYRVTRFRLEEGEALVLYTDGLTEARRGAEEEYGDERLRHFLVKSVNGASARGLVRAMRGDLAGFLGETAPSDDLTLMALRRTAA
jgi:sigma-B regulation protein RsbU (phosphoserine phosphatase)